MTRVVDTARTGPGIEASPRHSTTAKTPRARSSPSDFMVIPLLETPSPPPMPSCGQRWAENRSQSRRCCEVFVATERRAGSRIAALMPKRTETARRTPGRGAGGARAGGARLDAVEIKVTVRPDEELRALRTLELDEDSAEVRVLYFYDTPHLELFNAGVALRARLVKGAADDSTVKFRPVKEDAVSREWREAKGFKLE